MFLWLLKNINLNLFIFQEKTFFEKLQVTHYKWDIIFVN